MSTRDTTITIAGNDSWRQRTPLQIGDPELDVHCRQLAQLNLVRSLSRDRVTIELRNGGRSAVRTYTRAQLRAERGYRALYYWESE